jgi:aryl-phospho-beta-D-glucosidase BglC (GH1 family)/uncharacterized protein YjdB
MKKAHFIYILITLLLLQSPNLFPQNFLSSQGNKLVDSKGNTVRLTGVNWFGFETNMMYPHGIWARDCKSMLKQIKDCGFNCIRLPWSNDILKPGATIKVNSFGTDPYTGVTPMNQIESTFTNPLQMLDKIVEYCQQLNLKLILDNHSRKSDNYLNEDVWYTADVSEAKWIADWVTLATRYKNNDAVIAMDLDNEPNGNYGNGCTWGNSNPSTDWNKAAERCGNAILQANPNTLIVVEGIQTYNGDGYWWGGNLKGVASFPVVLSNPKKLVYSPHEYGPEVFNQTWFTDSAFPGNMAAIWSSHFDYIYANNTAPVLCGEFGIKDMASFSGTEGTWFNTWLAYMGNRYSWTFWCWNPNSGDTGGLLDDQWLHPVQWKLDKLKPYMAAEIPNNSASGNRAPVVQLTASPTSGNPPTIVSFDASQSSDPDGDALTFTWSFGDNTSGTGSKPSHTYTAIGTYSAVVTVSDGKGGTANASITITITPAGSIPVTGVVLVPTSISIAAGTTIQLTATVSPSNATNKNVSWTSSNPTIASVNTTGVVTGVAAGTATITVSTADGAKTAECIVTVSPGGTGNCTFGTPTAAALPTVNKSYTHAYVLGTGGPNLSNVNTFTINWDLPNQGFYQFSANTTNGAPNWYVDLRTGASQTFASPQPAITLSGTGFPGLDGSYNVALFNSTDFVMVSKTGGFAVYFTNSTTVPACVKSGKVPSDITMDGTALEQIAAYPNPSSDGNFVLRMNTKENTEISVKIYNQIGRVLLSRSLGRYHAGNHEIQLQTGIPSGVYFLEIKSGNLIQHIKLEVQ